ncbi:unnamed protein product [Symbiodinium sp. CCMP2592]|nr:unnamed protein product [Symbiodinium sp. CCMP2592]
MACTQQAPAIPPSASSSPQNDIRLQGIFAEDLDVASYYPSEAWLQQWLANQKTWQCPGSVTMFQQDKMQAEYWMSPPSPNSDPLPEDLDVASYYPSEAWLQQWLANQKTWQHDANEVHFRCPGSVTMFQQDKMQAEYWMSPPSPNSDPLPEDLDVASYYPSEAWLQQWLANQKTWQHDANEVHFRCPGSVTMFQQDKMQAEYWMSPPSPNADPLPEDLDVASYYPSEAWLQQWLANQKTWQPLDVDESNSAEAASLRDNAELEFPLDATPRACDVDSPSSTLTPECRGPPLQDCQSPDLYSLDSPSPRDRSDAVDTSLEARARKDLLRRAEIFLEGFTPKEAPKDRTVQDLLRRAERFLQGSMDELDEEVPQEVLVHFRMLGLEPDATLDAVRHEQFKLAACDIEFLRMQEPVSVEELLRWKAQREALEKELSIAKQLISEMKKALSSSDNFKPELANADEIPTQADSQAELAKASEMLAQEDNPESDIANAGEMPFQASHAANASETPAEDLGLYRWSCRMRRDMAEATECMDQEASGVWVTFAI